MKIRILIILFISLFFTECKNKEILNIDKTTSFDTIKLPNKDNFKGYLSDIDKEKIQLFGSDKSLELTIEGIDVDVNKYAFEVPKEKYSEKKFKEGYNLTVKYKIQNISDQKLIFKDEDYFDYSLFIISGPTSIEKLIQKYPGGSATSASEMRENNKFIIPNEEFKEHQLEKGESFTTNLKYFSPIDSDVKELYFGGFFTKPEKGELYRLFFKIERDNSDVENIKYKVVGKKFEKIDQFVNVHFYR